MLQIFHALNEMMVSNEVSATINYSCENERFNKLPPKMNVSMPKFIPKQINKKIRPFIWKAHRVFKAKKPHTSAGEMLEVLKTIKTGYKRLGRFTCLNE